MTTQLFTVHPENPQARLIKHIVEVLNFGGIIAYPTDSGYALGCEIGNKSALERIRMIRDLPSKHNFTLLCHDLSQISNYSEVSNSTFRLIKAYTPGAYTFILHATKEVPKRLQHPKRKTIGIRVPENKIAMAILRELNAPIMSVTLVLPEDRDIIGDAEEIYHALKNRVDVIVDGGFCGLDPTTVVDFTRNDNESPEVLRFGKGDPKPFLPEGDNRRNGSFGSIVEQLL